jgi:hypothetical protein
VRLVEQFSREIPSEKSREALIADALQTVTVPLARHGYELQTQTDTSLTYALTYRPWWVWVLTICLFPIGLLAYFSLADHAYVTMTFEQTEGGSIMRVTGEGTLKVGMAFVTMEA